MPQTAGAGANQLKIRINCKSMVTTHLNSLLVIKQFFSQVITQATPTEEQRHSYLEGLKFCCKYTKWRRAIF